MEDTNIVLPTRSGLRFVDALTSAGDILLLVPLMNEGRSWCAC